MDMFHLNIALVDDIQSELDTLSQILGEYAAASQLDLTLHCFHSAEDVLTYGNLYGYLYGGDDGHGSHRTDSGCGP